MHYDNNKQLLVQSLEKDKDVLLLRKKLAKQHGLTAIWEFIEWWAIVSKDNKWKIMDEQWNYMRDPNIKTIEKKEKRTWSMIEPQIETYYVDGLWRKVENEQSPVNDIVESSNRIFSAQNGIIIVVDSWSHSPCARFYTTKGNRILPPQGRDFDRFAITDTKYQDDFRLLSNFVFWERACDVNCYDRRKNIIWWMIPMHLSFKFRQDNYYGWLHRIEQEYNLWFNCSYNLMDTEWNFLKTELWEYYANNKIWFDWSEWLLPCIHGWLSNSTLWYNERLSWEEKRPVFYAIDNNGKVFHDEFWNILLFDDPRWIKNFDHEWYAPVVIDKKISPISLWKDNPHPYTDYNAYICFINKEWVYRKNSNTQKVSVIPFHKTIYDDWGVSDPDVRWYTLFAESWTIRVRQLFLTQDVYKYYDYYGNEIQETDNTSTTKTPTKEVNRMDNIDRWDTKERIYQYLSDDLILYGYSVKIDHKSPRWWLNSYWWQAKIINKNIMYKWVRFSDGKDSFGHDFDRDIQYFWSSYIFHSNNVDPKWEMTYECVKINWLIARYNKDEHWKELQWLAMIMKSTDEKYLFIQRDEWWNYYILDKRFQYIKDKNGRVLSFPHRPPFYVDGMFLYYNTKDWKGKNRWESADIILQDSYFEDGSKVWEDYIPLQNATENLKNITSQTLKRLL